jgi:hypothetical protein
MEVYPPSIICPSTAGRRFNYQVVSPEKGEVSF